MLKDLKAIVKLLREIKELLVGKNDMSCLLYTSDAADD